MTAVPEPSDTLIEAIALAYHRAVCAVDGCRTVMAEDVDGARAAYTAMREHLSEHDRQVGARALRQYADDLAENPSADVWDRAELVDDVRDYASDFERWEQP